MGIGQLCAYERLEDDIHAFIFWRSSREAVDKWLTYVDDIHRLGGWYGHAVIRVAMDQRECGPLPLRYLFERLDELNLAYAEYAPPQVWFAHIHNHEDPMPMSFCSSSGLLTPNIVSEYFEDVDNALMWLSEPI